MNTHFKSVCWQKRNRFGWFYFELHKSMPLCVLYSAFNIHYTVLITSVFECVDLYVHMCTGRTVDGCYLCHAVHCQFIVFNLNFSFVYDQTLKNVIHIKCIFFFFSKKVESLTDGYGESQRIYKLNEKDKLPNLTYYHRIVPICTGVWRMC